MKTKRIIGLLLVVMMIASLFTIPVMAAEGDTISLTELPFYTFHWYYGSKAADGTTANGAGGFKEPNTAEADKNAVVDTAIPLSLAGVTYPVGINLHPDVDGYAEVSYNIEGMGYKRFNAVIGPDMQKNVRGGGVLAFEVYVDGNKVIDTGVMQLNQDYFVDLDVTGAKVILIRLTDGGDGIGADYGTIAAPVLSKNENAVSYSYSGKVLYVKGETITAAEGSWMRSYEGGIAKAVATAGELTVSGYDANKLGAQEVTITSAEGWTAKHSVYVVEEVTYLSDMQEVSYVTHPEPTPGAYFGKDLSHEQKAPITINGVVYNKGIGLHFTPEGLCEVKYDLSGQGYKFLSVVIGKDDYNLSAGTVEALAGFVCQFEIIADGQAVWTSPVTRQGESFLVNLDITGVNELILRAKVAEGGAYNFGSISFADAKVAKEVVVETPEDPGTTPSDPVPPTETGDFGVIALAFAAVSAIVVKKKKEI